MTYIKKYIQFFCLILFFGVAGSMFAAEQLRMVPQEVALKLPFIEQIMKDIAGHIADAVDAANLALEEGEAKTQADIEARKKLENSAREHIARALVSLERLQNNYRGYDAAFRGSGGSGTDNINALTGDSTIAEYLNKLHTWGFERLKIDLKNCQQKFEIGITGKYVEALVQCGLFWEAVPLYARQWHPRTLKAETVFCVGISRLNNVLLTQAHKTLAERIASITPSVGSSIMGKITDNAIGKPGADAREAAFRMNRTLCVDHLRFLEDKVSPAIKAFEKYIYSMEISSSVQELYEQIKKSIGGVEAIVEEMHKTLEQASKADVSDAERPLLLTIRKKHEGMYKILESINCNLVKVEAQKDFILSLSEDQQDSLRELRNTPQKVKPWSLDAVHSLFTTFVTSLQAVLPSGDFPAMRAALAQKKAEYDKTCAEKRTNRQTYYPPFSERHTPEGNWLLKYFGLMPTVDNIDWLANEGLPVAIRHISYSSQEIEGQMQILASGKITLADEFKRIRMQSGWILPDVDVTPERDLIVAGGYVHRKNEAQVAAQEMDVRAKRVADEERIRLKERAERRSQCAKKRVKKLIEKYQYLLGIFESTINSRKFKTRSENSIVANSYLSFCNWQNSRKLKEFSKIIESTVKKLNTFNHFTEVGFESLVLDLTETNLSLQRYSDCLTGGSIASINSLLSQDIEIQAPIQEAATQSSLSDERVSLAEMESKHKIDHECQDREKKIASEPPILDKDKNPVVPLHLQALHSLSNNQNRVKVAPRASTLKYNKYDWLAILQKTESAMPLGWVKFSLTDAVAIYDKVDQALHKYKKIDNSCDVTATKCAYIPDAFSTYLMHQYRYKKELYNYTKAIHTDLRDKLCQSKAQFDAMPWWKKFWGDLSLKRGWNTNAGHEIEELQGKINLLTKSLENPIMSSELYKHHASFISLGSLVHVAKIASKQWKQEHNATTSVSADPIIYNATFQKIFGQPPVASTATPQPNTK